VPAAGSFAAAMLGFRGWVSGALAIAPVGCGETKVITPFADGGTAGDGGTTATTIDPSGVVTGATEPMVEPDLDADGTSTDDTTGDLTTSTTGEPASDSSESSSDPGDSSSTGDDAIAPEVELTSPADRQSGIAAGAVISVTFTEAMDPQTITTNVGTDACSGSIQVSSDDFVTCVPMSGPPTTGNEIMFTVTPSAPLSSLTTYRIRVRDDVTDAAGNPMAAAYTTGSGFVVRYFHAIAIDGVNDFTAEEARTTSTTGHTAYIAWDDAFVYFGMNSPDVASGDGQTWVVVYLGDGGAMGSTTGVLYNTQQPTLPFAARYHLRWRADNAFIGALIHDGIAWAAPPWTLNPGDVYQSGTFVEFRVSTVDLQFPVYLDVAMGILREQAFDEASWAAMPQGAYADGYDPDIAQYLQFDLTASMAPSAYAALP
jgi:hypothetical protein